MCFKEDKFYLVSEYFKFNEVKIICNNIILNVDKRSKNFPSTAKHIFKSINMFLGKDGIGGFINQFFLCWYSGGAGYAEFYVEKAR